MLHIPHHRSLISIQSALILGIERKMFWPTGDRWNSIRSYYFVDTKEESSQVQDGAQ